MKKSKKYLCICAVGAFFVGGVIGALWKLNGKINQVAEILSLQVTEGRIGNAPYIPDLDPGTDGWLVTQFGDPAKEQEMCYVITTDTGLAIVDGGYGYESQRLREIIAGYGNHVEAWILTHYHKDHIEAFLDIMEDPGGIRVDHVYTVERAGTEVMEQKATWDDFSMLPRFDALQIDGLEYLHGGDTIDLMGLKMEVLSAYEPGLEKVTNDLMNDGSMVFRISGREDTMLFCADVGPDMTESLTKTYGGDLKCDYIQMAHHGYGGPKEDFYRLADPEGAFFDAPDWLMNGENEKSTQENEALMREMDCVIFSYYTAPNQILLK